MRLLLLLACLPVGAPEPFSNEIRGEFTFAENKDFRPEDVAKGGRVVLPLLSDVDSFNPYLSSSVDSDQVHGLLWPLPLKERPDYYKGPSSFAPALVDRWSVEGNRISMHIRDDANWSDGRPVSSEDVAFSLEAARNPDVAWVNSSIVDWIEKVEAVDGKNYVLHYRKTYPDMLMDAKDWRILPKHVFGKIPFDKWKSYTDWDRCAEVVSGPYRIESYKHNQEFVFVPNAKYYDPALPRLEKVIFRVIPSQGTQYQALLTGEIDFMQGIKPKDYRALKDHKDLTCYSFQSRGYYYLGWNCDNPLFRDREVRRAMTLAIDRENLVETLFYGYARLIGSPIITTMWACDKSIGPLPFDPEEAERILQSKGWAKNRKGVLERDGKPFEFFISWNSGNEIRQKVAELVQANLREIGVEVKPRPLDFNVWSENLKKGVEDSWVGVWWVATKVDEKPTFHSSSIGDGFNYGRWRNARVDEIIDTARVEPDAGKARKLWNEFQAIFHEEQPYTLLWEPMALNALHKRFRNVEINSLDVYDNLAEWFVAGSAR